MQHLYIKTSIIQTQFKNLKSNEFFFEPLHREYKHFSQWFKIKSTEQCYITRDSHENLTSFFYMKEEFKTEDYSDLTPIFLKRNRLKIGTLLVQNNGNSFGNIYMDIALSHAYQNDLDEIYITFHNHDHSKDKLSSFLTNKWGFNYFGKKGKELVYIRNLRPLVV